MWIKIREFFDIPQEQEIVAVIAVGYAQEEPAMPKRKNVSDIANFYQG